MTETMFECEVCGKLITEEVASEGHHAPLVIRDGHHGQYLAPLFILDVQDLTEGVSKDIQEKAERWLASQSPSSEEELTGKEFEEVLDYSTYQAEQLLRDKNMTVIWEDGYVIYQV